MLSVGNDKDNSGLSTGWIIVIIIIAIIIIIIVFGAVIVAVCYCKKLCCFKHKGSFCMCAYNTVYPLSSYTFCMYLHGITIQCWHTVDRGVLESPFEIATYGFATKTPAYLGLAAQIYTIGI